MNRKIRVVVVDDSALMRKLIPEALRRDPSIEVVGTAMDGLIGLKRIEDLHPDVVTLDLEMPRMDGMEMLREVTRRYGIPVIVFAAPSDQGADLALRALSTGAFDIVTKPEEAASGNLEQVAQQLVLRVKAAAVSGTPRMPFSPDTKPRGLKRIDRSNSASRIVGIGVSTGGPAALEHLLAQLPPDFGGCLLVVQHMPEGFIDRFARRLNESSAIEVKEAQSGDLLLAGRALICPGNRHLRARRMGGSDVATLSDAPPVNGHKPAVDVLFESLAHEYATESVAVLMTGMGDDGVVGMNAVRNAGGITIAQSPDSCVVDSMPRSAIERRVATRTVHLNRLANVLESICEVEKSRDLTHKLSRSSSLNSGDASEGTAARRRLL